MPSACSASMAGELGRGLGALGGPIGREGTPLLGGGPGDRRPDQVDQVERVKPAKLPTRARNRSDFKAIARGFQHEASNMPAQARRKRLIFAIVPRPGRELLDPVELELAAGRQARDRGPKLFAGAHRCEPLATISGLYFIRFSLQPVRREAGALAMFPRSHPQRRWEQARKQPNLLICKRDIEMFPCSQEKRGKAWRARVPVYYARARRSGNNGNNGVRH